MFKIITIPFDNSVESFNDEILTNFSLNKRIKEYHASFFISEGKPYWSVFLSYDSSIKEKGSKSEIEDLNETEKLLLEKLKVWRRGKAEEEGVPVYIVATNSELKEIVKLSPVNLELLNNVKGFGRKKIEKYGKEVTTIINAFNQKP